ncbi:MAG: 3-isopropylmalate dehydratase small subunit [Candidatus Scalindua sp. AMX11]|nr:MAG: 3-isopropylmalate dehydratase small subunit [Candidatus Scalindua sp.]NOG82269.1 3-isopropylmalate dehydratase small subunit [Planctomycetota bacterium]RZV71440.1 MAG: 3-isopropylmalate dehydratase small subunit [Candidatus Scalindua sp. SCAELEC01]TDE64296.1 MAG: 3-isopropylmalate dehydratase small subunit [Candidatus Scalindua sp. AMX11]GJQ59938.1 MAG: 3-isopropylmalate dehydratase small subunit [Candidatus Scalindua sp.]
MKGKTWIYGDNVNTDEIIPARYLNTTDLKELSSHCMEDIDSDFVKKAKRGDILVVGENFGCGSSREHAPLSIKFFGISCIIAKSFARIFFRNAINIGLPIFESKEAASEIREGDEVFVDLNLSKIIDLTTDKEYSFTPFPDEMKDIIEAGGLMEYVKSNQFKG